MSRFPKRQQSCVDEVKTPNPGFAIDNELFRVAFTNSPAMHSIVRFADAVLVEVNDTFTKTLGYAREEVIGKTTAGLGIPDPATRAQVEAELHDPRQSLRNLEQQADQFFQRLLADNSATGPASHSLAARCRREDLHDFCGRALESTQVIIGSDVLAGIGGHLETLGFHFTFKRRQPRSVDFFHNRNECGKLGLHDGLGHVVRGRLARLPAR